MKKYFLIKSIHRDIRPGDAAGYEKYTITPITYALRNLSKIVNQYNKDAKRTISFEVYGVKGQETAVIMLRGPKAKVNSFTTALMIADFYEYFSLREVQYPDIYL